MYMYVLPLLQMASPLPPLFPRPAFSSYTLIDNTMAGIEAKKNFWLHVGGTTSFHVSACKLQNDILKFCGLGAINPLLRSPSPYIIKIEFSNPSRPQTPTN